MARLPVVLGLTLPAGLVTLLLLSVRSSSPAQQPPGTLLEQTEADVLAKSSGCLTCHQGIEPMHESPLVKLGCVDCHGGCASATTKEGAHVTARFPERWPTSGTPARTFALLNQESPEFVR